jgi:hypothetical protein
MNIKFQVLQVLKEQIILHTMIRRSREIGKHFRLRLWIFADCLTLLFDITV